MAILYSLVARGKTVLSEFTFTSGNFPTITRLLLAKIDCSRDGKLSYVYDQYVFHYVVENKMTFLCMADERVAPRGPRARAPPLHGWPAAGPLNDGCHSRSSTTSRAASSRRTAIRGRQRSPSR